MNKSLKWEYKKEIREIKGQNRELLFKVLNYSTTTMCMEPLTIDENLLLFLEVKDIVKEEKRLLNFIKRNLDKINEDEVDRVLDLLDGVNEETVKYYYYLLDNVEADFTAEKKFRQLETLIDTQVYRKEVYGLTLSMTDIADYLNYSSSFWEYILPRLTRTEEEEFYGVNIRCNEQNIIEDIRVFVPPITNLATAKINVHELTHAHDMYQMLGRTYTEGDYESISREQEKHFEDTYMGQKVKKQFGQI